VSGQLHAPDAVLPKKEPPVTIGQGVGWTPEPIWTVWRRENSLPYLYKLQKFKSLLCLGDPWKGLVFGAVMSILTGPEPANPYTEYEYNPPNRWDTSEAYIRACVRADGTPETASSYSWVLKICKSVGISRSSFFRCRSTSSYYVYQKGKAEIARGAVETLIRKQEVDDTALSRTTEKSHAVDLTCASPRLMGSPIQADPVLWITVSSINNT
jgi:hypothetical protein